MAYFNHAFRQTHVGTQTTAGNPNANLSNGFIIADGIPSSALAQVNTGVTNNNYGPGTYGFFNPKTWLSVDVAALSGNNCCPLVLASASLLSSDKIGPYHGGYLESNKSKIINPRHVQRFYKVETCVPQQAVVSVGNTPQTSGTSIASLDAGSLVAGTNYTTNGTYLLARLNGGTGTGARATVVVAGNVVTSITITVAGTGYTVGDTLTVNTVDVPNTGVDSTIDVLTLSTTTSTNFQGGTTSATCCFEFLCGETYYLRIDIKGSPALRFMNHNAYQTVYAYTGCCAGPTPTAVDSTLVMIDWAKMIVSNPYLSPFAMPVVYDEAGVAWYAPGTTVTLDGTNSAVTPAQWWDAYVSPGHVANACAGLRLFGAYVETKFGNCSFQITDFFEKEPVKIYASMVDYNGDPCVFDSICVYNDCLGVQGMGFGEQAVRDIILAESYLQNFFATDVRIREITQGDQILNSVSRNALYTRYFLLHSVPRPYNPTGVYDADRYLLDIIVSEANPLVPVGNSALETFVSTWLDNCPNCVSLETDGCTRCTIVAD